MDNFSFSLTEENVAIMMIALNFFCDINNNRYLTQEQYDMAQRAIAMLEDNI